MANYRNNGRKSSGNAVLGVVATILAVAFMFGAGVLGWFTHKWVKGEEAPVETPTQQGGMVTPGDDTENKKPEEDKKPDTGNTGTGSEQHDASESHGIKLMAAKLPIELYEEYGIAPASVESAYTITAKIEPENATVRDVDWTVYFKDGSSTWATGKTVTDYVTIKPGQEASCVVTCAQAFGEPIMVKVASHADSSIFATKQFDYVKRLPERIQLAFHTSDEPKSNIGKVYIGNDLSMNSSSKLDFMSDDIFKDQVGTVTGTATITSVYVKILMSPLVQKINEKMPTLTGKISDDIKVNQDDSYLLPNPTVSSFGCVPWIAFFKKDNEVLDFNKLKSLTEKEKSLLQSIVIDAANECNTSSAYNILTFSATVKNTYKEQLIEERTDNIFVTHQYVDYSPLAVNITDLQFEDSGNLVF